MKTSPIGKPPISRPMSCLGLWTRALQASSVVTQLGNDLTTVFAREVIWLRTAFNSNFCPPARRDKIQCRKNMPNLLLLLPSDLFKQSNGNTSPKRHKQRWLPIRNMSKAPRTFRELFSEAHSQDLLHH